MVSAAAALAALTGAFLGAGVAWGLLKGKVNQTADNLDLLKAELARVEGVKANADVFERLEREFLGRFDRLDQELRMQRMAPQQLLEGIEKIAHSVVSTVLDRT